MDRRKFLGMMGVSTAASLLAHSPQAEAFPLARKRSRDQKTRIGIVGAGVAGLSAAYFLKKAGYTNITVLEKSSRVGGKSLTRHIDGRPYELGTIVYSTSTYKTIMQIVDELSVETEDYAPKLSFLDPDNSNPARRVRHYVDGFTALDEADRTSSLRQIAEILLQFKVSAAGNLMKSPGLHGRRDQKYSMSSWAYLKSHGVSEGTMQTLRNAVTGIGYGNLEKIPVAYHMKYFPLHISIGKKVHMKNGSMYLWEAVKEHLQKNGVSIRLNSDIQSISQNGNVHRVSALHDGQGASQEHSFDELIFCCPMSQAETLLNGHPLLEQIRTSSNFDAKSMFQGFHHFPMHNFLIEVSGLPADIGTCFFPRTYRSEMKGRPTLMVRRHPGSDIFNVYADGGRIPGSIDSYSSDVASADECLQTMEREFQQLGLKLGKIHDHALWNYFPFRPEADMKSGFFTDFFKNVQGKHNTYFASSHMNFETAENTAQYSKFLVDHFFMR